MKDTNDKLCKILETSVKPSNAEHVKFVSQIHSLENENHTLKTSIQDLRYKTELEKATIQSKLELENSKCEGHKLNSDKSMKQFQAEIESLRDKLKERDVRLETLENSCTELKSALDTNKEELLNTKQQFDTNNNEPFQTVTHRRIQNRSTRQDRGKPNVILIETSNISGIDPLKLSTKFEMENIIAYDFIKTEEKLRDISTAPDLIVFHSLTNEMVENSVEHCAGKIKELSPIALDLFPGIKVVLSAPTPRLDSEVLNSKGQLISAMLKHEYLGAQNIYICDNSNLSYKGKPIDRFLSTKDGFHLSNQGITMFAANIRDTIDEVLNLPKRNTSPRPQTRLEDRKGNNKITELRTIL